MKSDNHTLHLQRARQSARMGRVAEAERIYREVIAGRADHPEANLELATLLTGAGRVPEAANLLEAAVGACPDHLELRLGLARIMRGMQRKEEAVRHYEHAAALNPNLAPVWCNLGNIYRELVRPDEAERCLLRSIELQPDLPEALNNLGSLYSELGRASEAADFFRRAIRHRPDYFNAWRNLSVTRKFTELDDEVRAMQALYEKNAGKDFAVMQLGFALGKACEDLGQPADAFRYWTAANRAQRRLSPYSVHHDVAEMRDMRRVFDAGRLATSAGASRADLLPIFVLGMPRSGTSLTEQILASHSAVHAAGELETVRQLAWYAVGGRFPGGLEKLDPPAWRLLGQRYLDSVAAGADGRRFVVDKMPRNFQHIGIIRMMLRDARIIHCRRDPMDIGLSCFKNHFMANGLGYSCDLDDLGTYYRHYDALMDYWNRVLPGEIFEIRYEDFVVDPERHIRRMLTWCGMPFEESCLNFHRNRRMVATASATQIRQPIHQEAVRRWRAYETELEPLKRALERPVDT